MKLKHQFVEFMPDEIQEGVVYISLKYKSVIHKCACGCGNEVNTPLHPTGWKLLYDGESVSLKPSIGNWSYDCQSHYWITKDEIRWSNSWTKEEIDSVRKIESFERKEYFRNKHSLNSVDNFKEKSTYSKLKSKFKNFIQGFFY